MKKRFKLLGVGVAVLTAVVFVLAGCEQLNLPLVLGKGDTVDFVAVTNISGVPKTGTAGTVIDLGAAAVEPEDATSQAVKWSLVEDSAVDATFSGNGTKATPLAAGVLTLKATVAKGETASTDYVQIFQITVAPAFVFVPVTGISGVPDGGLLNEEIDLGAAAVEPEAATNKTIVWTLASAGATGVTGDMVAGGKVTPSAEGTLVLTATVAKGLANGTADYTQVFVITATANFVPVTGISGAVPAAGTAGTPLDLSGVKAEPPAATNKTIVWSAAPGSATVSGTTVTPAAAGTLTLRATVAKGKDGTVDYTKDFTIAVEAAFVPVTDISGVPAGGASGTVIDLGNAAVEPEDATSQAIEWTVTDAGTTGVTGIAADKKVTPVAAGTLKLTATVAKGKDGTEDYTKEFEITVTADFVAVTNISGVPAGGTAGTAIDLSNAAVEPDTATSKTVEWTLTDAGTTGVTGIAADKKVTPVAAGTLKLKATVAKGKDGTEDYTKEFEIAVVQAGAFVPVDNISGVPTTGTAGTVIDLGNAAVTPNNATSKTIVWTVKNAGTTGAGAVTNSKVTPSAAGTLTLTATVANGLTASTAFTKDFTVTVAQAGVFVPVTDITWTPPTGVTAGSSFQITGAAVVPSTATNQNIVWSVVSGEATISGTTVTPSAAGTLTLKATVTNGATPTADFPQNFYVTVAPAPVTLNSVTADGVETPFAPTAKITLTFSGDVSGLTAGDIEIEPEEEASITKGALTAKGSGVYELAVEALLEVGPNAALAVSVTAAGTTGTQTATLYPWIGIDGELFAEIGGEVSLPVNGWYKQTADITINNPWTPIAADGDASSNNDALLAKCFSGVFDGGGFEIIPNNITSSDNLGVFANAYEATFQNVHIGTGSMTVETANKSLGGIVAGAKNTTFINCSNAANLTGTAGVGGICSLLFTDSIIDKCQNTGNITSQSNNIGGICASIASTATIKNCSNSGSLTISGENTAATMHLGGIAGTALAASSVIEACYNTGDITGSAGKSNVMGGIVGRLGGIGSRVTACYNTGNISSSIAQQSGGLIYIGGITGINMATTSNTVAASYNTGSVTHTGAGSGANVKVGGISGLSDYSGTSNVVITTSYWKADTATNGIGGKRDSSTSVSTAVASDEGTSKFASGTWPSSANSGWGIGNDSASGKYWKNLGTASDTPSSYPTLWFE